MRLSSSAGRGSRSAKVVPLTDVRRRTGRGSPAGRIRLSPDWDSAEVNEQIADDFGLPS